MAQKEFNISLKLNYDTEENWEKVATSFVPLAGQMILIETETGVRMKCGNNVDNLATLPYQDKHILDLIQGLEQALDNKVDNTFTINGQPMTGSGITVEAEGGGIDGVTINGTKGTDFTINTTTLGAVPTTRTVNGKALSSNISLTASDVGALSTTGKAASASTADTLSSTLAISKGGTASTTVLGARSSLGANKIVVSSTQPASGTMQANDLWLKII